MAGALDALVTPRTLDMVRRARHLRLEQGQVAAAPDPHGRRRRRAAARCGGFDQAVGGMLARYQLRLAVSAPGRARSAIKRRRRGGRDHARKLAQSSLRQPLLGDALELEEQHVPRLLSLRPAGVAERRGMADGQGDQVVDTVGGERGDHPRQRGAPVVTDDVGPLDPEVVEHAEHVADEERQRVRVDLAGRSDSPKPRRSGATSGIRRR